MAGPMMLGLVKEEYRDAERERSLLNNPHQFGDETMRAIGVLGGIMQKQYEHFQPQIDALTARIVALEPPAADDGIPPAAPPTESGTQPPAE